MRRRVWRARTNQRNGYRHREFDTTAGTLDLAIPKLRHGSYFPDWLLERRKRAERAPPSRPSANSSMLICSMRTQTTSPTA